MSGTKIINLDRVIGSMMHHPRIKGMPLYTRVDGQFEEADGRIKISDKGSIWAETSKHSYSSPDNIRRIFITYKSVYVHLYKPVIGVKDSSLRRETKFPTDFMQIKGDIDQKRYIGQKPEYAVKQLGLGALCRPWVCSNIEEVYFDWSLFLSEDVMNLGMGDFFNLYQPGHTAQLPYEPIKALFEAACLRGVKELRDRFPRLRCVGYIEHLEEIYNKAPSKVGTESIEDMMKPWYVNALVAEAIKNPSTTVSIYNIPGVKSLNAEYSLKDGIYVYDRDVLKDYFINLEARIKDYARKQRDHQIDEKKDELVKKVQTTKSSFEVSMDDIYAKEGANGATIALKIAFHGTPKEEMAAILNNMSTEGQTRYKKLLGIVG